MFSIIRFYKHSNFRFIIFISLFIIAFSLSFCTEKGNDKKAGANQSKIVSYIEGTVVKPSKLENTISVSGTLKPFEETVLMPDIQGRIISINLNEGLFVSKGTLLIKLFDDDLQAQFLKLQTQLQIAELTLKRQDELKKVDGISQSDFDQAKLQVNSIKGDIEIVKAQIRKTEVLAPFDGVIGLRNVSLGAIVNQATALATIRQVNQLKIDFSVPGIYSKNIKSGMKVTFTIQGTDKKFEAIIKASEEGIDAGSRNLKVRAIISSPDPSLISGAFANVELKLNENNKAFLLPTQSIIPQERNKKIVVSKNGIATYVVVKTGLRQDSLIEILKGVSTGDTVVTTGILFIKPGSSLKFSKIIK